MRAINTMGTDSSSNTPTLKRPEITSAPAKAYASKKTSGNTVNGLTNGRKVTISKDRLPADFNKQKFELEIHQLFNRERGGHTDHWTYHSGTRPASFPGGNESWTNFITEHGGDGGKYYVVNDDIENIKHALPWLKERFASASHIVDYGSGDAAAFVQKVWPIIQALSDIKCYTPIDLSKALLDQVIDAAKQHIPEHIKTSSRHADFYTRKTYEGKNLRLDGQNRLGLVFGSTITNMEMNFDDPFPADKLTADVKNLIDLTKSRNGQSGLAISFDSNSDIDTVLEAYNNPHWERLLLGLMVDVGSILKPEGFLPMSWESVAITSNWDDKNVVHYCAAATERQQFPIRGQEFTVEKGDAFPLFNILKPHVDQMQEIVQNAGGDPHEPIIHRNKRMVLQTMDI